METLSRDLEAIRRRCSDRETRRVLVEVLQSGVGYKLTKNGVMIYGKEGQATVAHYTNSDHRAAKNLTAMLRRIGVRWSDSRSKP